ncbi:MAG: inositol monophosphatase family protein [Thermomicrobium sp.]|nr:inositol monophosphatase [Thermomicrobium sp.]MDW8060111.1 inositol monophosphatase family protein [Thermomicrobium sp.]
MSTFRQVAIAAALAAGRLLRQQIGQVREIQYKGAVNLVTEVDLASERLIVETIRAAFPDHAFFTEEGTARDALDAPALWVIDPLDGTTNYAHGYPMFCVSIAFVRYGRPEVGVVYQPVLDELFVAERGVGAFLNGERIRVSRHRELRSALLATGFPYDLERRREALAAFARFTLTSRAIRRDGSAALDLAYVAAGRFDGFWERELSPWDTAAGVLLVEEAGGTVTDYAGRPFRLDQGACVASNGLIHEAMLTTIAGSDEVPR